MECFFLQAKQIWDLLIYRHGGLSCAWTSLRGKILNYCPLLKYFTVLASLSVKKKKKEVENGHASLPHLFLSLIMEKWAAVQMGADGAHLSGILNMIGWESRAVFLSLPQRTSVTPEDWTVRVSAQSLAAGITGLSLVDGPRGHVECLQYAERSLVVYPKQQLHRLQHKHFIGDQDGPE